MELPTNRTNVLKIWQWIRPDVAFILQNFVKFTVFVAHAPPSHQWGV